MMELYKEYRKILTIIKEQIIQLIDGQKVQIDISPRRYTNVQ